MIIHSTSFKSPNILKQNFKILVALSPKFPMCKTAPTTTKFMRHFNNKNIKDRSSIKEGNGQPLKWKNFQNLEP